MTATDLSVTITNDHDGQSTSAFSSSVVRCVLGLRFKGKWEQGAVGDSHHVRKSSFLLHFSRRLSEKRSACPFRLSAGRNKQRLPSQRLIVEAKSVFQAVVQQTVQMPQKQRSLRKPRHAVALACLPVSAPFSMRTTAPTLCKHTGPPAVELAAERNEWNERSQRNVKSAPLLLLQLICCFNGMIDALRCLPNWSLCQHAPCNNPGKSIGWGVQHEFFDTCVRKWCQFLIGREHVTASAWQKPW